jgi:NAD(P)-dependent dehydrogenase (short-subunit alcohol dehydrogenase family)
VSEDRAARVAPADGAGPASALPALLEGRVAVVTGAGRGIGAAIVRALAAAGAGGGALDLPGASRQEAPPGWVDLEADVRDEASLAAAFAQVGERLGRPQVVVANAGIVPAWSSTATIEAGSWDEVMAVNARGVALTLREAARTMQGGSGGSGGSIVVTCSLNGWKGDPHLASYVASKHAVLGLVRSAALDLGSAGIRVNAVGPGPIATDALLARMTARVPSTGVGVEDALGRAASATALGRIATADEVATAVLFLASDLASAITGHLLPVDCGIL